VAHAASNSATASVFYRSPGRAWKGAPLRFVNRGRIEGCIPAADVKGDVVEYFIHVADGPAKAIWPLNAPTRVERLSVVPKPFAVRVPAGGLRALGGPRFQSQGTKTGPGLIQLEWNDGPAVRVFRVDRMESGKPSEVALTRDTWFEDRSVRVGATYRYEVTDADTGRVLARSNEITVPEPPIPSPPEIRAIAGPGRVRLLWNGGGIDVGGYAVYKGDSPNGPFTRIDSSPLGARSFPIQDELGKSGYYQVRALSLSGKEGAPSNTVVCTRLAANCPPVLALDFDGTDRIDIPNRVVEEGLPAMRASPTSFVSIPHSDAFNTDEEITVEFWVKLMSPGAMPVFVSHGQFDADGFFIQLFGGHAMWRFFLGGVGVLDAGHIDLGKWTHVAATYDGRRMTLYLNGVEAGSRTAAGTIRPANRTLYVGRYEIASHEYEVDGFIARFRLYSYALSPSEAQEHSRSTAQKITGR